MLQGEAAGQEGSAEWELEWVSQEQVDASRRQEELAAKMEALNEDELIKKVRQGGAAGREGGELGRAEAGADGAGVVVIRSTSCLGRLRSA